MKTTNSAFMKEIVEKAQKFQSRAKLAGRDLEQDAHNDIHQFQYQDWGKENEESLIDISSSDPMKILEALESIRNIKKRRAIALNYFGLEL